MTSRHSPPDFTQTSLFSDQQRKDSLRQDSVLEYGAYSKCKPDLLSKTRPITIPNDMSFASTTIQNNSAATIGTQTDYTEVCFAQQNNLESPMKYQFYMPLMGSFNYFDSSPGYLPSNEYYQTHFQYQQPQPRHQNSQLPIHYQHQLQSNQLSYETSELPTSAATLGHQYQNKYSSPEATVTTSDQGDIEHQAVRYHSTLHFKWWSVSTFLAECSFKLSTLEHLTGELLPKFFFLSYTGLQEDRKIHLKFLTNFKSMIFTGAI